MCIYIYLSIYIIHSLGVRVFANARETGSISRSSHTKDSKNGT